MDQLNEQRVPGGLLPGGCKLGRGSLAADATYCAPGLAGGWSRLVVCTRGGPGPGTAYATQTGRTFPCARGQQHGHVDIVPVYTGKAGLEQSVTRYFLSHYVSVCERFNFATAESDYEECGAFHAAQRNQAWYALWNPNNPASPLNVHKDGSTVSVQVEAVSFFQRASGVTDLAQVRYLKAERQGDGAVEHISHWIATVQYLYATPSKDPRIRRWNPLGFKILELTAEPEAAPEPTPARPTVPGR